jgi:hypothetical protein
MTAGPADQEAAGPLAGFKNAGLFPTPPGKHRSGMKIDYEYPFHQIAGIFSKRDPAFACITNLVMLR